MGFIFYKVVCLTESRSFGYGSWDLAHCRKYLLMLSTTLQKYEVKSGTRLHTGGNGQVKCESIERFTLADPYNWVNCEKGVSTGSEALICHVYTRSNKDVSSCPSPGTKYKLTGRGGAGGGVKLTWFIWELKRVGFSSINSSILVSCSWSSRGSSNPNYKISP